MLRKWNHNWRQTGSYGSSFYHAHSTGIESSLYCPVICGTTDMLKDSYRGKRVILCLFATSGCKSRCSIPFYVMLSELSEHGLALPCVRWKPSSTDKKPTKIATWRKKKNQTERFSDGIRKQESGTKQGVLCQCCFSHSVGYRSSWKILTIARFTQAVASWVRVASSSCSCIFFSSLLQVQKWEWCNRKTRHLL